MPLLRPGGGQGHAGLSVRASTTRSDDLRLSPHHQQPAPGASAPPPWSKVAQAWHAGAGLLSDEMLARRGRVPGAQKAASGKLLKFADLIDSLRRAGGRAGPAGRFMTRAGASRPATSQALEQKNDHGETARASKTSRSSSPTSWAFWSSSRRTPTLSGFLDEIALLHRIWTAWRPDDDCVAMMTIHSAKGLEFPDGVRGGHGGGDLPRHLRASTTRRSWRRSGGCATWP